jgi:hypothetical protein
MGSYCPALRAAGATPAIIGRDEWLGKRAEAWNE